MKKIVYICVTVLFLSCVVYAIDQAVIISACRQGDAQVVWEGEDVTTWPVMWGHHKDPHDPNKYLITFMQSRKSKTTAGVDSQTFTQSSDGTYYKIVNNTPVPVGKGTIGFVGDGSPLYRLEHAIVPGEENK